MYSHYQVLSKNTLPEYNDLIQKFNSPPFIIKKIDEKTTTIIRKLGIFECIKSFFELSIASLQACCSKQPYLVEAWTALKNRQWIQIVELKSSPQKGKFDLSDVEVKEKFENQLIEIIRDEEKQETPEATPTLNSSVKFRQMFVDRCLKSLTSLDPAENEINAERINTILENPSEMDAFVKGLSSGSDHSLLFRFLLNERRNVLALSAREARVKRLSAVFKLLSEVQFDAMIKSGEFLEMCGVEECRKAIINSFTVDRLGKFAASWKNKDVRFRSILDIQGYLREIIKSLPADRLLLGKLVAILPHLASPCKEDCSKKIASLPAKSRPGFAYDPKNVDASKQGLFKNKLEKLMLFYMKQNDLRMLTPPPANPAAAKMPTPSLKPQKHYDVNLGHLKTIYNADELKKSTLNQAELDRFIQALESNERNFDQINTFLSTMDKASFETFVRSASSKALERYWEVESRAEYAGKLKDDRVIRLKWAFASLSEEQIKSATDYESFLKILLDNTNGCSEAVGEAFTVDQLTLIASNPKTHHAFIKVIEKLTNEKFCEFLPKLIPHCSRVLKEALINKIDKCFQIKVRPVQPKDNSLRIKSKKDFKDEIEARCRY